MGKWLERLIRDLRIGARRIARTPDTSGVAIVTFALGVGAAATVFSVVNAVFLRPAPYPEAERLAFVHAEDSVHQYVGLSESTFREWRRETAPWLEMAAYTGDGGSLSGGDVPQRVTM